MDGPAVLNIEGQIESLRRNLLDLTMRNQLLNFKARTKSIEVINEIPTEIYNLLVLEEKKMQFLPKSENKEDEIDENGNLNEAENSELTDKETSTLWKLPSPNLEVADKYKDPFLQTDLKAEELQKRLFYLNQQSKSMLEEQGYNILYLAIGFLEWKESADVIEPRKAPLLLIPVELERKKVKGSFKLKWTGEDIIPNISLQAKLQEQGVAISDFEMPEEKNGVYNYFKSIKSAISSKKDWKVVYEMHMGFFSFTKFVMYKDLDPESWKSVEITENPIIESIFDPSGNSAGEEFFEDDVDKKLSSKDIYHVVDADSSQIAVIEESKAGKNMVVEGPPGTGKSQTIVNLIAELMANGKTVLFVSEKMAALEVVKDRLDGVGLGDFCLELHSRKSNKREVLNELERTLYSPPKAEILLDEEFNEIEKLKSELDGYNEILHKPLGEIRLSPFKLFGLKEEALDHFNEIGRKIPRAKIKNPDHFTRRQWQDSVNTLEHIGEVVKHLKPLSNNPWKDCMPEPIFPVDLDEISYLTDECTNSVTTIKSEIQNLADTSGIGKINNLEELQESVSNAKFIMSTEHVDKDIFLNPKWDVGTLEAYNLIEKIDKFQQFQMNITQKFDENILNTDVSSVLREYKESSSKLFKSFRGGYKKAKENISVFYKVKVPENDDEILHDMEAVLKCQKLRNQIREHNPSARSLFGSYWVAEQSNTESLRGMCERIPPLRKLLSEGSISEKTIEIVSNRTGLGDLNRSIQKISDEHDKLLNTFEELDKYIKMDKDSPFKSGFNRISFDEILSKMELFKSNTSKLQQWSQLVRVLKEKPNELADPVIELVLADKLEPEDLIPCLKGNFADDLLRKAFLENSVLSGFMGDVHEDKIEKFIDLDRKLIELNRKRIASRLSHEKPNVNDAASPNSELGILLGEFNRKRGHMPIRKLLSRAGSLIQRIKPCFMMSPLSIAQFIDPKNVQSMNFDVVIFDEASQVKPEDAIGAFLRGKQAVVMGDTRQLPPTSFFDIISGANEDEEYEIASFSDMESILHLCKSSFPTKMLRWHYRSRHESLIALSNQEFYNNNLLIYPSPCHKTKEFGLKFEYLPDTVYDRGRSSSNRKEARKVVEAAVEHFKEYGFEKSLGIGTFNMKQQQVILEEVELYLKNNHGMEEFFSSNREEHFFVKNLETIQGDERDVIFISVGYGYDNNGKLSLNFGPLNKEGGERRLNVLITRAREKCVVFSNFKFSDVKIDSNGAFGVRALKAFLEYAETKNLESIKAPGEDTKSPFEDSVYDFLSEHGYEVHKQVGCAGFRIDLAVVNPLKQGEYLLGIECDGATYHSSPVARDRDRLRQQILEGLGWHIYKVWSTDWYRNRGECEFQLIKAVENSKNLKPIVKKHDKVKVNPNKIYGNVGVVPNEEVAGDQSGNLVTGNEITTEDRISRNGIKNGATINLGPNDVFPEFNGEDEINTVDTKSTVPKTNPTTTPSTINQTTGTIANPTMKSNQTVEEPVSNYELCPSICIDTNCELHEKSVQELSKAVVEIVDVEGPVHFSEVVRRIRTFWGLKKAGKRIQNAIKNAVLFAQENREITIKDEFLFRKNGADIKVRRRCGDPPAKINLICDEEIERAVVMVLNLQFATPKDEIIKQTSRLFGIKVTRGATAERIETVIQGLINRGELEETSNGTINFAKS